MVTERLEPDIPEALTLELGLRRNRAEPKWLRCWARPERPWTSCPNSP